MLSFLNTHALFIPVIIRMFSLWPQNNSLAEWIYKKSITYRTYGNYHPIPVPLNLVTIPIKALYDLWMRRTGKQSNKTGKKEKEDQLVCDHGVIINNRLL